MRTKPFLGRATSLGLGVAFIGFLLGAACGDEKGNGHVDAGGDAAAPTTDTGAGPAADAGAADSDAAAPDGGAAAIPITDWVHDLVVNFGPMSAPDTVDDKNIKDTDDPGAFDPLLQ